MEPPLGASSPSQEIPQKPSPGTGAQTRSPLPCSEECSSLSPSRHRSCCFAGRGGDLGAPQLPPKASLRGLG